MHKVVVTTDSALLALAHCHQTKRHASQPSPLTLRHGVASHAHLESWVPLDYTCAQLLHDAARHWHLAPLEYELCDRNDKPLQRDEQLGVLLEQQVGESLRLVLRQVNVTIPAAPVHAHSALPWSPHSNTASAAFSFSSALSSPPPYSRDDPFWLQEKLFELFLFYALQNASGKSLCISCYQFKSLLQRAAASRILGNSTTPLAATTSLASSRSSTKSMATSKSKLGFDTRVLLAFKGAVGNSNGSSSTNTGASFDQFLDALVDVASFLYPKATARTLAFEHLTTEFVIPQFDAERYAGGVSTLSWQQIDALVAAPAVYAIIQRFTASVSALATTFSSTIGGARTCRGLQFHEFSKFVRDLGLQTLAVGANELCDVFLRCCRAQLKALYSDTTTLASLYFTSTTTSKASSTRLNKAASRTGSAGGHFATHGGGNSSTSDALTESGGALEVTCVHAMHVLAHIALLAAPPIAQLRHQPRPVDFTVMSLSPRLAQLSIQALLQHMANCFSRQSAHPSLASQQTTMHQKHHHQHRHATQTSAASARARVQFLHEFHKMHQRDGMCDYLSELSKEIRSLVQRDVRRIASASLEPAAVAPIAATETNDEPMEPMEPIKPKADDPLSKHRDDDTMDVLAQWAIDSDSENDDDSNSDNDTSDVASCTDERLASLDDLFAMLNDGDEIYSFIASELQRHAALDRRIDDTDTVAQMLDMWVAAGHKYAQVLAHVDASMRAAAAGDEEDQVTNDYASHRQRYLACLKASVLQRFGHSLYVLATQLLRTTTRVYAYEARFGVTNARIYGVHAPCWDGSRSVFTTDLAMETLSMASSKLTSACNALEQLLATPSAVSTNNDRDEDDDVDNIARTSLDGSDNTDALTAKYLDCTLHRAKCLAMYGDTLAHNTQCVPDYELGCLLEEELDAAAASARNNEHIGAVATYRSTSSLSKTSPPGQFYREAHRMLQFIVQMQTQRQQRVPLVRVHVALASTQFKLATHLPRGCVAEKKLLEDALVTLALCPPTHLPSSSAQPDAELDVVRQRKAYISAIVVLRHKFFQPETAKPDVVAVEDSDSHLQQAPATSSSATPVEELVSPFYRFVLAAAFKDFDTTGTGVLQQPQLSALNSACGRSSVSEATLHWLLCTFDHQSDGLTERGLLQYFCWIAEADPLAFCEVLDLFTSKYTETHHASITTSRPAYISKEPKAKSLRSILFSERRQYATLSSSSTLSSSTPSLSSSSLSSSTTSNKHGIAECVVVLSGKMTPEACGDISATQSPRDIRLESGVIDVLPSTAALPDELSKLCFPDDVFLCETSQPPTTFDIVLTDVKGERLYGTCLHFYEQRDPMDVLALIANVQRGKRAQLPTWISLRDIQQHQTQWQVFVPKCLCVLSSEPLFATMRNVLTQLYRLSLSPLVHYALVETLAFYVLAQVTMPSSHELQTSFHLLDRTCLLTGRSPGSPAGFYPTEVDFTLVFQCLSLDNILKVYTFLLTEKKVVVCATNVAVLTPVMETLRALLYPFESQVVYIPVLPLSLLDFVSAPVPFFMGVRSDARVSRLTSEGIVVVDLDTNDVALPLHETMPTLPDVKAKKLMQALKKATSWVCAQRTKSQCGCLDARKLAPSVVLLDASARAYGDDDDNDVATLAQRHSDLIDRWSELQTLFTGFATRMLKGVRKYCSKVAVSSSSHSSSLSRDPSERTAATTTIAFDKRAFLTMHPSLREFCTQLFQTQLFQRYLERSSQDGGATAVASATEQEGPWLSARSAVTAIWKSEPAEDTTKAAPLVRQIVRAPSPIVASVNDASTGTGGQQSSPQRRASRAAVHAFPPFNVAAYDDLVARHASPRSRSNSSSIAPSSDTVISMTGAADVPALTTTAVSTTASAKPLLAFHSSDTPAAKLVSAARQRLDAAATRQATR